MSLKNEVKAGAISQVSTTDAGVMVQITTPLNPPVGANKLYFKSDNKLYKLTSAGVETEIGAGGGGGVGTVLTGNSNITGTYDGDLFVKAGSATMTGHVNVYGNLYVGDALINTGGYSLFVTGNVYVNDRAEFIPLPATVCGDINIKGDFICAGNNTGSAYDSGTIIVTGDGGYSVEDMDTDDDWDALGVVPGLTIEFLTGANTGETGIIDYADSSGYISWYGSPMSNTPALGDTFKITGTVYNRKNIVIQSGANNITMTVGGDLYVVQAQLSSLTNGIPSPNIYVGGDVTGYPLQYNYVPSHLQTQGALHANSGTITIVGTLRTCDLYSNGGASATDNVPAGNVGFVHLGEVVGSEYGTSIITNGGANTASSNGNGGSSGDMIINGTANVFLIERRGGNASNGAAGGVGSLIIYGDFIGNNIATYGGNGANGHGGAIGTVELMGTFTCFTNGGGISSMGGNATGATKAGGAVGNITVRGDFTSVSSGQLRAVGGGNSSVNGIGGNAGLVGCRGRVIASDIWSIGGNGYTPGNSSGIYIFGSCYANNSIQSTGGSGNPTGGNSGSINFDSASRLGTIDTRGGTGTVTNGTTGDVRFTGEATTVRILRVTANNVVTVRLLGNVMIGAIESTLTKLILKPSEISNGQNASLRIGNTMTGEGSLYDNNGANPTASQLAVFANRLYTYSYSTVKWSYVTTTDL